MIANVETAVGFTVGACLFNLLWNTTHPYLLAAQASFDRSGRQVSFATAMQMLGIAAGPTVGSAILDAGGTFEQIMVLAGVMMVVTLVLIQPPVLREAALRRKEKAENMDMALIRYLTVRVKKHDLEENYFGEKSSLESKQK